MVLGSKQKDHSARRPSDRVAIEKALPILGAIAAGFASLGAFVWMGLGTDAPLGDLLALLTFLAGLVAAIFLFIDREPLAVSMGVLMLLLSAFAFIAFFSPWVGSDGDIIPPFPFVFTYPFAGTLAILVTGLTLVARWEDIYPRWHLWAGLAVAWLAAAAFFLVRDPGIQETTVGAFAAAPGVLSLGVLALNVLMAKEA